MKLKRNKTNLRSEDTSSLYSTVKRRVVIGNKKPAFWMESCQKCLQCRHGKTLALVILSLCTVAFTFTPSMDTTIKIALPEGNIAVYDKAMPEWLTTSQESYFHNGEKWEYQFPDRLANVSQKDEGNLDWASQISPEFFMKSKPWLVFKRVLANFTGRDDYLAYDVTGVMLRRGDSPNVVKGKPGSEDVYARLFLTVGSSGKSEMLFYDKNGDIAKAVNKKFNRIVVWNATLDYQFKQPDFNSFNTEYSIFIKMSRDKDKMKKGVSYVKQIRETEDKQKLEPFPTFGEKGTEYTNKFFEDHLTRRFYDYRDGVIAVFDNIMNETELGILRKYLINHNTGYSNTGFSTTEYDDTDNVSWIVMFLPEILAGTRILDVVTKMAAYLSGEDGWHPYDVSLNMIQKTFHTRIHEDCETYEFEYTFLLYLNPNWTAEMYGETIFLNQIQDIVLGKKGKVIRDKAYETIVSVTPKYGRMVIFRNNIPHSARPPSPDFHGSRYTFAVKVSRTRILGLAKILRELLEFKSEEADEGAQLYKQIGTMAQSSEIAMKADEIVSNIEKYRKIKMETQAADSQKILDLLLRSKYIGEGQPTI